MHHQQAVLGVMKTMQKADVVQLARHVEQKIIEKFNVWLFEVL